MPMNQRIAEHRTFGRPDTDAGYDIRDEPIYETSLPRLALIGRFLLAAIFLVSGVAKLTDTSGTIQHMTAAGIPYPETLALVAGAAEVLGAISIATGLLARVGSLGLFLYLIPTTLIFHAFWKEAGEARLPQMVNFMKNLAIMGGLAVLAAQGAGKISIDHRFARARARRRARREV